jgi:signal transduction histidine kinase/CheY-like chemotaxis protein
VVVWVTVGNGLRYGRPYMIVASIMAQIALITITLFTPAWQNDLALVVTLSITVFLVPYYAQRLLRDNEKAKKAAQDANLAKSRFLAQASHDLRQPVHAIGLFLHNLKQTGLSGEQRTIVGRIDRSLHGVAGLFRSLLDISTLDSGALVPRFEVVSIRDLFEELEQQNRAKSGWAETDLRFVTSKYEVHTDKALLSTMVQNLISNAVKYAPNRPVLVGCRRKGQTISIVVYDRGDGIAAEHIPHLFEEFYQVRKVGNPDVQGVGLGLSIVQRLASLLGLEVTVMSREGYGTSVAIGGLKPALNTPIEISMASKAVYHLPLKGLRILLVEDDADVLEATADLLCSWGCKVQPCTSIPEHAEICDIIITDFDIGGSMTGLQVIASVRERLKLNVPAIVMTGHDQNRITDLIDDPHIPILKKPVTPAEMRSAIGSMGLSLG